MFNFTGFYNDTYYNAYNSNFTKKPTIFMSNIILNLRKDKIKQSVDLHNMKYNQRSKIPNELILDIWKTLTTIEKY